MAGRWYSKAQWQKRRAHQLRNYPLCAMCLAQGITTPATIADHVTPHRGDSQSFWYGTLQSLCKYHHDSTKQLEEAHDQGRYARQLVQTATPSTRAIRSTAATRGQDPNESNGFGIKL
jgi:5-methylcytosine-specific restriction enzyme A